MSPICRAAAVAILMSTFAAANVDASCMRYVPEKPGAPPQFDGPGSFGPLNNTVSLDCLSYEGFASTGKGPLAIVEDENGATYRIKLGDFVGENSGRVAEITEARIMIVQLVHGPNKAPKEVSRYLFRKQKSNLAVPAR